MAAILGDRHRDDLHIGGSGEDFTCQEDRASLDHAFIAALEDNLPHQERSRKRQQELSHTRL